ncbi:MAG: MBL fold metallo-hydrolase [Bacilli bacterium]|jgi:phosphoribosyl 1,2-cyclic phosphodiesterase
MKIAVLGSGSKGNCTYIEYKNTKILIDFGLPVSYVKKKLNKIGINYKDIDGILISHTHIDHIKGLSTLYKLVSPALYITEGMQEVKKITSNYYCLKEEGIKLKDLFINTIPTSHDVTESVGFIIKGGEKELVYITDTGYINHRKISALKNKHLYVLESNHDAEMLLKGTYPYHIKQRILSDIGHLSNKEASRYLAELIGEKTKSIILAHLSEQNNCEELALKTLKDVLNKKNKNVDKIVLSKQHEATELIEV